VVKITGREKHLKRLNRMRGPEMVREVGKALFAAGNMIQVEAQISITAGSISGKGHIPSKPGEPPNRDTGDLDMKIETAMTAPLKVEVSSNSDHAVPMEVGTSKVAARPYMAPAAAKKREEATNLVRKAVDKVIQQSG